MRNEDALRYNEQGVAKLASSDRAAAWLARLLPGREIAAHTHDDCEDNSLVLTGALTYLTGMAENSVPKGGWTVARTSELHGYRNSAEWPLHLLLFTPMSAPMGEAQMAEIRQRVFKPTVADRSAGRIYQTQASRGLHYVLTPGVQQKLDYARAQLIFVVEGRIMALMVGEKASLDGGEGVFVRKSVVELVGVAGQSTVAVFSTRP